MTQNAVDLVQFKKLQSLNWKGLNLFRNYKALSAFIKAHGHQIRSLTLDILWEVNEWHKWLHAYLIHEEGLTFPAVFPPNVLALKVLNLERGSRRVIFDSLENLHLSSVSFKNMGLEMLHAFNIEQLKSLSLQRCGTCWKWLREILRSGKSMNLRSFEFTVYPTHSQVCNELWSLGQGDQRREMTEIMCGFIRHNPELENLYLMLPDDFNWATLADTLSSHHHLTHIVMHQLGAAPSTNTGMTELMDTSIPWSVPLKSLLQGGQLTSFGSPTPPGDLVCTITNI
ncbi:hypothetical protein N7540_011354 [Penicillium herquei]|nr:hypothetical protein N7540_011354 [Penicillium herquei]